jgi:leader peptidase (prepilin peptidase)/N-methyltransferase
VPEPLELPPAILNVATFGLTMLGLLVGSFLNVVIWRVPRGASIVHPPSHCPRCGAPILAFDNVPVLAWLALRGRCRCCRGPISARYPVVEALTGLLTFTFVQHDGLCWLLPFHLVFLWAGIALALIDLDTFLLPLVITLPLIPVGIASGVFDPQRGLMLAAIGAGAGWALIVLVGKVGEAILKKEAMGGGDAWLMASIGAFTGPFRLFLALFLASFQGALVGGLMVALRKRGAQVPHVADGALDDWQPDPTAVPFGPFLVLGALECLLVGSTLIERLHLDLLQELLPTLR